MVNCNAERGTDGILTTVTLSDAVLLIILAVEVILEIIHDALRKLRKTILLDERQHCHLHRSKRCRNAEDNPAFAVFKLLLVI